MNQEKAKILCENLMEYYKLGKEWRFDWINTRHTYGKCNKHKRTIFLSKRFVECNNEDEIRNTILHEIAHAKCRKIGHNKYWRAWCVKLGARPIRLDSIANRPK